MTERGTRENERIAAPHNGYGGGELSVERDLNERECRAADPTGWLNPQAEKPIHRSEAQTR